MKYRKKPVEVFAERLLEPNEPWYIASWCRGRVCGEGDMSAKRWIEIDTLEGVMKAEYGDWIIKGVKGEFYPCKNDIFELTYGKVEE
jgi:hypothetical protein